jgi:AAA+ ATPase superfamily predicted ATPase
MFLYNKRRMFKSEMANVVINIKPSTYAKSLRNAKGQRRGGAKGVG